MKNIPIPIFLIVVMIAVGGCKQKDSANKNKINKKNIEQVVRKVADWQLDQYEKNLESRPGPGVMNMADKWGLPYYDEEGNPKYPLIEWTYSTYYVGLYKVAEQLNDDRYLSVVRNYAEKAGWQVGKGPQRFFADHHLVGYIYSKLYAKYGDPEMIADFRKMADGLIAKENEESLELNYETMNVFRVWAWSDAMFTGPPSLFALSKVTREGKYRDLADSLFWNTNDYLYDKKEHLYSRDSRFFDKREKNGEKMFWSRGNGWVLAGLALMLEEMPKDYPTRGQYKTLFKEMASRVASLQKPNGMWSSGLLDPKNYPEKETSGTSFYCYALAWGIDHNLLDEKIYRPVVLKAWKSLAQSVHPNGKLGYVQKVAEGPGETSYEDTEDYGVGAFLLAGTEMLNLKQ